MKTDSYLGKILTILNDYKTIDRRKVFREDLGEKGLKDAVEPIFDEIIEKINIIISNIGKIEDHYVYDFIREVEEFKKNIVSWSSNSDSDFVNNRQTYIDNLKQRFRTIFDKWVFINVCLLDASGIIQNIDKIDKLNLDANKQLNETLKKIESIKEETLKEVRSQASEIKKSAQKTARNISVKAAQEQFDIACKKFRKSIWIWTGITFLMLIVFGVLSYNFYFHSFFTPSMKLNSIDFEDKFIDILRWESIYHTIIRVSILAVIGTIIAFCLKMLRGNLHMFQHNLHRQRVANSLEAFVSAALTDEQSDRILEKLVESVVSFGQSGLIQNEDDSVQASKLTIDSITKTLTSK